MGLESRLNLLWDVLYSSMGFNSDDPICDERSSFSPVYCWSLGSSLTIWRSPLIDDICVDSVFSSSYSPLLFNLPLEGYLMVPDSSLSVFCRLSRLVSRCCLWLRESWWLWLESVKSLITDCIILLSRSSAILSARDSFTLARWACSYPPISESLLVAVALKFELPSVRELASMLVLAWVVPSGFEVLKLLCEFIYQWFWRNTC